MVTLSFTNAKGHDVTVTWLKTDDLEQYKPCFQAYSVVFNDKGQILLIQEKDKWKIPGGTPEEGETAEQALRRELIEEADVTVSNILPLGVQKVEYPNNPSTTQGDVFYQYRYICLLDELHEPSPDPATGLTHPRMFVPADEVTRYVEWGTVGQSMFTDAIKLYKQKLTSKVCREP